MSRLQQAEKRMKAESALSGLPHVANLTEHCPAIHVAIVSEVEATALADSLEALLVETKGFTFSRFDTPVNDSTNLDRALGCRDPDVLVATLGLFSAKTESFVASLRCHFPHCPVLVSTIHPDTFDFLRV